MLKLVIGQAYIFTLNSGKEIEIIVQGAEESPQGVKEYVISVDGLVDNFDTVNRALVNPFVAVRIAE